MCVGVSHIAHTDCVSKDDLDDLLILLPQLLSLEDYKPETHPSEE